MLLLDEPLSALDAKVRTQLRDEIRRVQLEVGTTTLFVTHDQEEALAVADRVGVMSQGRLEQLAAPADLYANPATPFVAEFVGLNNKVPARGFGRAGPAARHVGADAGGFDRRRAPGWRWCGRSRSPSPPTRRARRRSARWRSSGRSRGCTCTLPDGAVISAQMASSAARAFAPGDPVTVGVEPTGVLVVKGDAA